MAEVFLAHNAQKKAVVIKRILPHLASDLEYVKMFQNEFGILSKLRHPHIVRVMEVHHDYAVMEYLEGQDWRSISQYPISQKVLIALFVKALEVLAYVHDLGIIHRDISPQNWMLTLGGDVKLLDFGISKMENQTNHTATGVLKGKYGYMSPEQAAGEKISCLSDIFSMGVILFEFCTQSRLFKRSNDLLTLKSILACEVEVPAHIPAALGDILKQALAKDQDRRFQSCEEFRTALLDYGRENRLIASQMEVVDFVNRLPRLNNRVLFEATQASLPQKNLYFMGVLALAFGLLGMGW